MTWNEKRPANDGPSRRVSEPEWQAVTVTVVGAMDGYLDLLDKIIDQPLQEKPPRDPTEVLSERNVRWPGVPHVRALTSAVLKLLLAMVESGASTKTPPAILEMATLVKKKDR